MAFALRIGKRTHGGPWLLGKPNGAAHYGVFRLLQDLADKCPVKGLLITKGGLVLDDRVFNILTNASAHAFREAVPLLVEIGWLEEVEEEIKDAE